jgi:hypothetical protein
MRRDDRSSRILLVGAWVSLAGHIALMVGFVRWSDAAMGRQNDRRALQRTAMPAKPPEEKPPPEPMIRLGLEKSDAATMAWLGFEKATEHQADKGAVDQSAMTLAAPGPGDPSPEIAPTPAPEAPAPAVHAAPESPAAPSAEAEAKARELAEQRVKDLSERVAQAERRLAEALTDLAQAIPAPPPPPPAQTAKPPTSPPTPDAPKPNDAKAAAKPGGGGLPGIKSNKESIAAAVKKAPTVRPGQVLAGQGLEIQTRQPHWTYTTMMTRSPRNPTVKITFGRDGKVKQADFVSDGVTTYNSGYDDVDEPLINAIYGWTAKGKAINELKADDPNAGVTILITIILTG